MGTRRTSRQFLCAHRCSIWADAVPRGYVSEEHHVSSIEIGNEIMNGAGETWINDLSLEVR